MIISKLAAATAFSLPGWRALLPPRPRISPFQDRGDRQGHDVAVLGDRI